MVQAMTTQGNFYDKLEPGAATELRAIAERIQTRMKRVGEDLVETGFDLIAARGNLADGEFTDWLRLEFEMSRRTAYNFINVAERFGRSANFAQLGVSVLYELASPSTPDEVVEETLARARAGEKVSVADVRANVKDAKAKAKRKTKGKASPITPAEEAQLASAVLDEGKKHKEVQEEFGVSDTVVRRAVAEEEGRREAAADPVIDPSTLSLSAQEKLAAAIRQHKARLDAEHGRLFAEEMRRHLKEVVMPMMQKRLDDAELVIKARNGVMTRSIYKKIWGCLHPDRLPALRAGDPKLEQKFHEAFILFSDLEVVLCDEKQMPTSRLVLTPEMMAARKEAVRSQRRAQRAAKGNTHMQPSG